MVVFKCDLNDECKGPAFVSALGNYNWTHAAMTIMPSGTFIDLHQL